MTIMKTATRKGRQIETVLFKTELKVFYWGDVTRIMCYYNGGLRSEEGIQRSWSHLRARLHARTFPSAARPDEDTWNWLGELCGNRLR